MRASLLQRGVTIRQATTSNIDTFVLDLHWIQAIESWIQGHLEKMRIKGLVVKMTLSQWIVLVVNEGIMNPIVSAVLCSLQLYLGP